MNIKKIDNSRLIIDILTAIAVFLVIYFYVSRARFEINFIDEIKTINSTMIGVWATILGFLITAVSILLTVKETKFIVALKSAGHFKNLLKTYIHTCYLMAVTLLYSIAIQIMPINGGIIWWIYLYFGILCLIRIFSCLRILVGIIDLAE